MTFVERFQFVVFTHHHWQLAAVAGGAFAVGMLSAVVVVRSHLHALMNLPLWLTQRLMRFIQRHAHFPPIFLLIFLFNSVAIGIYMLTGVLPMLPSVITFLTGMNIGIVIFAGGGASPLASSAPTAGAMRVARLRRGVVMTPAQGCLRLACFLLVMGLELPAFWFAIAMGTSIGRWWTTAHPGAALAAAWAERLLAYVSIIVPVLALSAAIEAFGILLNLKDMARAARKEDAAGPSEEDDP